VKGEAWWCGLVAFKQLKGRKKEWKIKKIKREKEKGGRKISSSFASGSCCRPG